MGKTQLQQQTLKREQDADFRREQLKLQIDNRWTRKKSWSKGKIRKENFKKTRDETHYDGVNGLENTGFQKIR